ncbi:phosphatase PAP2-related protein [Spirosoma endophyticum]|uniref:PAP2 superfamily C-terminal n=1 Tax=Spirosoma endophyticum TaxID=662367 RepID=A0A1I1MID2_9BACT|nr:phosphatase PAP2-related protein [Spirosoma endophyticum]SFC81310.1 PAP2 superfamily C-terminal [Spirosoma endophyticum]
MSILSPNPVNDLIWNEAWRSSVFRTKFMIGVVGVIAILITFPYFFQTIEQHTGPVLNDWLLSQLPPYDVSLIIFLVIWAAGLLILIRSRRSPTIFLMFIYSYIIITLSRMISINLFPLNPPVGLIPMVDPLTNAFYGKVYITKDLFYSGHTSTIFLIFLCLRRRMDRLVTFIGTLVVASLLLVQHVHYTIDIVGAFVFTYPLYRIGKKIALSGWNTVEKKVNQNASPN